MPGLATGHRTKQPPYQKIKEAQHEFFHSIYLPSAFIFKDGRNLKHHELTTFFDHVYKRQQRFGPKDAFQFSAITDRQHNIVPAEYATGKPGNKRKKKTKKGRQALAVTETAVVAPAPTLQPPHNDREPPNVSQHNTGELPKTQQWVEVDQETFARIHGHGWQQEVPQTGPDDGTVPHYSVPLESYNTYIGKRQVTPNVNETHVDIPIDPALMVQSLTPIRILDGANRYPTPNSNVQTPAPSSPRPAHIPPANCIQSSLTEIDIQVNVGNTKLAHPRKKAPVTRRKDGPSPAVPLTTTSVPVITTPHDSSDFVVVTQPQPGSSSIPHSVVHSDPAAIPDIIRHKSGKRKQNIPGEQTANDIVPVPPADETAGRPRRRKLTEKGAALQESYRGRRK